MLAHCAGEVAGVIIESVSVVPSNGLELEAPVRRLSRTPKSERGEGPLHFTKPCSSLVPSKGLEPPHRCRYMDLNHARLPIPPRWQSGTAMLRRPRGRPSQEDQFPFYSPVKACQTAASRPEVRRRIRLSQLCRHRNLRPQNFRYRTALLRGLRVLLKRGRIRSRNFSNNIDVARRNRPS